MLVPIPEFDLPAHRPESLCPEQTGLPPPPPSSAALPPAASVLRWLAVRARAGPACRDPGPSQTERRLPARDTVPDPYAMTWIRSSLPWSGLHRQLAKP